MDSSALSSILRAAPSVPSLAMRRAVIERGVMALPPAEAAVLVEELAVRAGNGGTAARSAMLALVSLAVHQRRGGTCDGLAQVCAAAEEAGLTRASLLCGASTAPKSLPPGAKLPEVGLNREAYFPSSPKDKHWNEDGSFEMFAFGEAHLRRFAALQMSFLGESIRPMRDLVCHPKGAFLTRVLRTRWIRQADVLIAATRRPSTPEIAIAIAADDRWLCNPSVREALVENPFTPSWLAAGLALTLPCASLARRPSEKDAEPVTDDAP